MPKAVKMKVGIIGPPKSGKTSFISNLLKKPFKKEYDPTQTYEVYLFRFSSNKAQYQVQLWECGCEHFTFNKHLRSAFFRNCSASLLMFDLSDEKWKNTIPQWLQQAYQFDCFLVYAIGTKKKVFFQRLLSIKNIQIPEDKLTETFLEKNEVESPDQFEINNFFSEYQIKHYFQEANERVHSSIKNIFISINDDRQKLTRTSLAQGRRFDNSIVANEKVQVELVSSIKIQFLESVKEEEQRINDV